MMLKTLDRSIKSSIIIQLDFFINIIFKLVDNSEQSGIPKVQLQYQIWSLISASLYKIVLQFHFELSALIQDRDNITLWYLWLV